MASAVGRLQLDMATYLLGAHHEVDGRLYQVSLSVPPHLPFTYPPFAALAFAPLTVLSEPSAQVVWSLVSVAALFALLYLSVRAVRPQLPANQMIRWSLVLMTPAYLLEPVRLTFYFGQVNVVLAAMVLADLTGHLRLGGRTLPRGVLLGAAAAVKLVPLVFVPYLFVTRQTRAAWVALATMVGCTLVAGLTDPRVSWSYWTKYAAVVLVAGIALAAWASRVSSRFLGILVCATTGLLVSPITWAHHLVWVAPVLVWLVWGRDRPAGGRLWAAATAAVFWWGPIWSVPNGNGSELHEHGWQLLAGNSFFLATVVFMVGVAAMLWRRQRLAGMVAGPPRLVVAQD